MAIELKLGALTLVGDQAGTHVGVIVLGAGEPGQRPLCGRLSMTVAEFSSLQTVLEVLAAVDARHQKDRAEIARLDGLVAKERAELAGLRNTIAASHAFFTEAAQSDEPMRRELAKVVVSTLDKIVENAPARSPVVAQHEIEQLRAERDVLKQEVRELEQQRDELSARLAGAEAANAAVTVTLVEHSELNGHIETAEQCRDYLNHQTMDEGDPSGRLQDFTRSLGIVIEQLDRQRRSRNWFEAAYEAGKQKLIESALDRRLDAARIAARALVAAVDDLGAFADDTDPRVMATAGPIGKAQADLWLALGLDLDAEHARLQADIDSRCAVCGWPLAETVEQGCTRGNCSYRPRPEKLYAPERAKREALALRERMEGGHG